MRSAAARPAPDLASITTAPPKPPPVIRAPMMAGSALPDVDEPIDLGRGDGVVVAHRRVRRIEQPAERGEIAGAKGGDCIPHALVLGDDVAGTPRLDLRQPGDRRQRVGIDIAQVRHAERRRGGEGLAPAIAVAAAGVLVRHTGVDHHQLEGVRPRNPLEGHGASVDEERLARAAEAARHLVHDADRRADEIGLDAMGEPGDRVIVEVEREQCAQAAQQPDAQRRARRHTAADRDRRGDPRVEAGRLDAVIAQDAGDALHIVDPAAPGLLVAEREGGGIAAERRAEGAHTRSAGAPQPDVGPLRQHHRHDVALVVVGVLADQVDAAGGLPIRIGRGPEREHERVVDGAGGHGCTRYCKGARHRHARTHRPRRGPIIGPLAGPCPGTPAGPRGCGRRARPAGRAGRRRTP